MLVLVCYEYGCLRDNEYESYVILNSKAHNSNSQFSSLTFYINLLTLILFIHIHLHI